MTTKTLVRPEIDVVWMALLHRLLRVPLRRDVLRVVVEQPGLVPVQIVDALAVGDADRPSYNLVWNAVHELAAGRLIELRTGTAVAPRAHVTAYGRHCHWFVGQVVR